MEYNELVEELDKLKKDVEELKRNRFYKLSTTEDSILKEVLFERTAATLASGASLSRYAITTINGKRGAVPVYDKFTALI